MSDSRSSYAAARWTFLRLLGLTYGCAFASLAVQIVGLVGHDGVLPAAPFMAATRGWMNAESLGAIDRVRLLPTLCWLSTTDTFLRALCIGGSGLALLVTVGVAPAFALPMLWVLYLSVTAIGREFLSFQWDALLIETGLIAIVAAPAAWRERRDLVPPSLVTVWLMRWLLFRLMFGSGLVKLASGDPSWRNFTALAYHYETQPIPNPIAWYFHAAPHWFTVASTAATLAIELLAPWGIFFGRRARLIVAVLFIGLQVVIAATGNFAFFNLLAASLCVWLLDDEQLASVTSRLRLRIFPSPSAFGWRRHAAPAVVALVWIPVSLFAFTTGVGVILPGYHAVAPVAEWLAPLRIANRYGLFAVMTTTRPEIIVEGSNDGATWQPYEFRYKVGDPTRRPPFVAPHQPRIDWQLWFAALDRWENEAWFRSLCQRLLEGSPDVLALVDRNPFPNAPPRYLRAELYDYRFSDRADQARGVWWTRTRVAAYSPVLDRDQ